MAWTRNSLLNYRKSWMPKTNPYELPFPEAIAFFKNKVLIPGATWNQILDEANNWAFFVSQVSSAQLLQEFHQATLDFIKTGKTFEEFKADFDAIAQSYGWTAPEGNSRRAYAIADTNLRTAYAAGRYHQMADPDVIEKRPYWEYRHRDSPHPRPHHLALDGKIFAATDVLANPALAVPSGFGCRCTLIARRRLPKGKQNPDPVPNIDGVVAVMVGEKPIPIADKGWNYIPGHKGRIAGELLDKLSPEMRAKIEVPERL